MHRAAIQPERYFIEILQQAGSSLAPLMPRCILEVPDQMDLGRHSLIGGDHCTVDKRGGHHESSPFFPLMRGKQTATASQLGKQRRKATRDGQLPLGGGGAVPLQTGVNLRRGKQTSTKG
jgi:hypothetical protein